MGQFSVLTEDGVRSAGIEPANPVGERVTASPALPWLVLRVERTPGWFRDCRHWIVGVLVDTRSAWGAQRDLNPQKLPSQGSALTVSATYSVGRARFELAVAPCKRGGLPLTDRPIKPRNVGHPISDGACRCRC